MGLNGRSGRGATLRVVIADDNVLLPVAVRALLEPDADIEVAGVIHEADRVLPLVAELRPDLLLLGSAMPGSNGLALLDRLCTSHPDVAVVLLADSPDPILTSSAFKRGAKGVIVKGSNPNALAPALRAAVWADDPRVEPALMPRVIARKLSTSKQAVMLRAHRAYDDVAARVEALRVLVDRAIFRNDYDWLE